MKSSADLLEQVRTVCRVLDRRTKTDRKLDELISAARRDGHNERFHAHYSKLVPNSSIPTWLSVALRAALHVEALENLGRERFGLKAAMNQAEAASTLELAERAIGKVTGAMGEHHFRRRANSPKLKEAHQRVKQTRDMLPAAIDAYMRTDPNPTAQGFLEERPEFNIPQVRGRDGTSDAAIDSRATFEERFK